MFKYQLAFNNLIISQQQNAFFSLLHTMFLKPASAQTSCIFSRLDMRGVKKILLDLFIFFEEDQPKLSCDPDNSGYGMDV